MVKEGSSCSKTMALPCGDQDGLKSRKLGSPESRLRPSPSRPIIQISELGKKQPPPPQNGSLVSKAILSPLGDQSGIGGADRGRRKSVHIGTVGVHHIDGLKDAIASEVGEGDPLTIGRVFGKSVHDVRIGIEIRQGGEVGTVGADAVDGARTVAARGIE